ncbi:MAG: HEAT repeat domain-containing protein [Candidatus Aminicenantes bacterium]|nr:HEAT repeat domain-containing protein [Candidatus Aminicenantes bacterium]
MPSLKSLFGPPDIDKLKAQGNIDGLIKALNYRKDSKVRSSAAFYLGHIRDKRAVDPLINTLQDENRDVVSNAIGALNRIGDIRAVDPIIDAINGPHNRPEIFWGGHLADLMMKSEDTSHRKRALNRLIQTIKESIQLWERCQCALEALRQFEPLPDEADFIALELLESLSISGSGLQKLDALANIVEYVEDVSVCTRIAMTLIESVSKSYGRRIHAVPVLAKIITQLKKSSLRTQVEDAIRETIGVNEYEVRLVVVEALGHVGTVSDLQALSRQLSMDVQNNVQKAAAKAMGQIDSEKAAEVILELVRKFDSEEEAKSTFKTNWFGAAEALGDLGEAWVVNPLISIFKKKDFTASTRSTAAEALGKIGDDRAVEPLISGLTEKNKTILKYSVKALKTITKQNFGKDAGRWQKWLKVR